MAAIRITAKRQATFPRAVCDEMGVEPGDRLMLERREIDGERVWVLRPEPASEPTWFACLRSYARGKRLSMGAIRRSILEARKRDDR